jgi:hypothetical protein
MNPLYNQMNRTNGNDFITRFNQFRQTINGDPRAQVQSLLNSGRVSQEQYNMAVQQANQLMKFIK